MPTEKEFYDAAKIYTTGYMKLFENDESSVEVYDHLLWPQHKEILGRYFDENFKMIIVDRDPRDLFILNKYFLHKPPISTAKPYFPTDATAFAEEWKRTVTSFMKTENVMTIHFEDLVYNYEKTVEEIECFLNLEKSSHRMFSVFDPQKSIENTQTFLVKEEWINEVSVISEKLSQCCYSFPYERIPDKGKWFDTPDNETRKTKKVRTK